MKLWVVLSAAQLLQSWQQRRLWNIPVDPRCWMFFGWYLQKLMAEAGTHCSPFWSPEQKLTRIRLSYLRSELAYWPIVFYSTSDSVDEAKYSRISACP